MASPARFLNLAPTEHALVTASANEQVADAIDIPVVQKTQRSSSTTTTENLSISGSPPASTSEAVLVDDKTRFLKLGN
ncbi:hypothetical protein DV736_g6225, partial [Chaetothyriales sp. CBS 134916]